ncbi:TIGR04104 family putative zinc finger protein [Neobacillus terrae]|uniref:TIGR04104 family putative zinc finger protein n=1 Tax=Neobacillus terrae TaxID=3034837 RepID=UPI00140A65F9|nr:TIGR04104 family putative zinc finger protein [Neobacillus terrae]NHM31973.1 hypothetical protein [Neobacillus terrae]
MSLPKCSNCNHQFKWISIFKRLWKFNQVIGCPNCKTKLYPSSKFRNKVSYLSLLCLFVSFGLQIFNIPNFALIPLIVILWVCLVLTMPYIYSFDSKERPLW